MRALPALLILAGLVSPTPGDTGLEVSASKAGFQPSVLHLHKGEPARLVLKTADVEHCFALDEFRIEKRIVPGKATSVDFTPDKAGTYAFYCCLEPDAPAMKGKLIVAE
ncbi:MAG TPA: cupredoxin domain-containing protein [Vicinamibacteria bacterium]|nr:cupredoxin domain-containing protein [Vicinamibacteria bacterium]